MGLPCTHSSPLIRGLELPLIGSTGRKISYWSPLRESGLPNYLLLIYLIFFPIFQIFLMGVFFWDVPHGASARLFTHATFFWFKMDGWMDGWMTGTARYFLLAKMQMSSAVSSVVSKDFFQLVPDAKHSSTWGKATMCVGQLHVMFCIPNRTLCKCVTLAEQTVLAACVHATSMQVLLENKHLP